MTVVLDTLAAGMSEDGMRSEHPTLPSGSAAAAIACTAELANERVLDLPD